MEGVDHLGRLGEHHRVDRRIGGRHVEGADFDPLLPGPGLFVQPAGHIDIVARRQDVDDLVMFDVGHGGGVVLGDLRSELHECGLVQADGAGLVQPPAIGRQEGLSVGGHGIVDRVPVTGELASHLRDGATDAHLDRRPLRGPGGEQTVLGRDVVVGCDPALLRTARVGTAHPVLLPAQAHRGAKDGQIDVADDRAFFHLSRSAAARAPELVQPLLDHELDLGAGSAVVEDSDVLQPHQSLEDLTRVDKDKGASGLLSHISSLERLCSIHGGPSGASGPR